MSVPHVEAEVTPPPETGQSAIAGEDRSARLSVGWLAFDDVHYDAGVQFVDNPDPEQFAEALLSCALALAAHRGADYSWAAMRRFSTYGASA